MTGGCNQTYCRQVRSDESGGAVCCLALVLLASAFITGCGGDSKPAAGGGSEVDAAAPVADRKLLNSPARFREIAESAGLRFTYYDGQEAGHFAILEMLGGGVALFDYDADGTLDLFLPGGGRYGPGNEIFGLPGKLFRNAGDSSFYDVTLSAGADQAPYYSHRTAVGHHDDDG